MASFNTRVAADGHRPLVRPIGRGQSSNVGGRGPELDRRDKPLPPPPPTTHAREEEVEFRERVPGIGQQACAAGKPDTWRAVAAAPT